MTIGLSVPNAVRDGKVTEAGSPLWVLFLVQALALPGLFFCMYAYWRARKKTTNLGLFFICLAAYFVVALIGLRQEHDPDNPTTSSFILAICAFVVVGAVLFVFNYTLVRRFASGSVPPAARPSVSPDLAESKPSTLWKVATRIGRLLLFFVCLFLSRVAVSPKFVQQDWPRVAVFMVVLLLSCLVSGLISEETVSRFLSFLNFKPKNIE